MNNRKSSNQWSYTRLGREQCPVAPVSRCTNVHVSLCPIVLMYKCPITPVTWGSGDKHKGVGETLKKMEKCTKVGGEMHVCFYKHMGGRTDGHTEVHKEVVPTKENTILALCPIVHTLPCQQGDH